jgi:type I restriction enzyme, R subunit
MLEIRREMQADEERVRELGLSEEEIAFYDAVAVNYLALYGQEFLRDLVHEVVQLLKRTLKVDWTESHREDVKAAVKAAVRRVLRRRGVRVEDLEPLLSYILVQAEALYVDWPVKEYVA